MNDKMTWHSSLEHDIGKSIHTGYGFLKWDTTISPWISRAKGLN